MSRSRKEQCKVFPAEGGFRPIQRLSREEAELRVRMEVLTPEYDSTSGAHLGYRVCGLDACVDQDMTSMRTTTAISLAEMERNLQRSITYGLDELQRLERLRNGLPMEDEVERAQAKIRVYPFVGPKQGAILEAWPR